MCQKTIRRWHSSGILQCSRTPGGHRHVSHSEIHRVLSGRSVTECKRGSRPAQKTCAVHARVSGHHQKTDGDLARQLDEFVSVYRHMFGSRPRVFTDIGSGLNMRRRGLRTLLRVARQGLVNTVLVTHSDRLARFGLELLERLFSDCGVTLEVVHETTQTTPQEELVTDLMALIASFSGLSRRRKNRHLYQAYS